MAKKIFQIRDPIHGVIEVSEAEHRVIESREFLRLRRIKQLGFAEYAYPGATHSRFAHSCGAMAVATKIFDRVISPDLIEADLYLRMRQTLRLSALFHDLGHAPLSHTTEMQMPMLSELMPNATEHRQASHEDYTRAIISHSSLSHHIDQHFSAMGIEAKDIGSLLGVEDIPIFQSKNNLDFTPLMRQIISSEIDCDRMDYLLRDSFFCGVNYGKFDIDWLIDNLIGIEHEGKVYLGLKERGIFAFEDFLLSRYHMFVSVYLHHTPVIMDIMLRRYFDECPQDLKLPANIDDYLKLDDVDLWLMLKQSQNRWARRIVEKKPYVLIGEAYSTDAALGFEEQLEALKAMKIDVIFARSQTLMSKYFGQKKWPLFVETRQKHKVMLEEFSQLFRRYEHPTEICRIFVDAEDKMKAEQILKKFETS